MDMLCCFKLDVCKQMLIVYDKVMMDLFDVINKNCFFIFSDIIHGSLGFSLDSFWSAMECQMSFWSRQYLTFTLSIPSSSDD